MLGTYLPMSAETGETLAVMDATRLTAWRTAAASALASRHLSRPDAGRLLMVGAGALAPFLVRAHASVRPIREVTVWNRSRPRAAAVVAELAQAGIAATVADDLAEAAAEADIVSTATLSSEPVVRGAWLKPGTHLDCVGAFKPTMRETDDEAARRARIFVDTRAGAFAEAGDILQPLQAGAIRKEAVLGELAELCRGVVQGRSRPRRSPSSSRSVPRSRIWPPPLRYMSTTSPAKGVCHDARGSRLLYQAAADRVFGDLLDPRGRWPHYTIQTRSFLRGQLSPTRGHRRTYTASRHSR